MRGRTGRSWKPETTDPTPGVTTTGRSVLPHTTRTSFDPATRTMRASFTAKLMQLRGAQRKLVSLQKETMARMQFPSSWPWMQGVDLVCGWMH
ncbi:unnamed protein product [Symbiodinium sp. CCMP2456]|nr:unnamed protein product [Symbiodinium sp. CCMP2456]